MKPISRSLESKADQRRKRRAAVLRREREISCVKCRTYVRGIEKELFQRKTHVARPLLVHIWAIRSVTVLALT